MRSRKKSSARPRPAIYLHYGDADHRPMQTTGFHGGATELRRRIVEAKRDGWPLRVHIDGRVLGEGRDHAAEALRLLGGKRGRRG